MLGGTEKVFSVQREIISERTRDKIAAARRRGQWAGGWPILGYDLDRERHVLEVNPQETKQVRALFELYLQHQSLNGVAQVANERGWQTKPLLSGKSNPKMLSPTLPVI